MRLLKVSNMLSEFMLRRQKFIRPSPDPALRVRNCAVLPLLQVNFLDEIGMRFPDWILKRVSKQNVTAIRPKVGKLAEIAGYRHARDSVALSVETFQSLTMRWISACLVILFFFSAGVATAESQTHVRPPEGRDGNIPRARWGTLPNGHLWSRAAVSALRGHGAALTRVVPRDISEWCPAYPNAGAEGRAAFWVGLLSALSKHESTYRASAVGGGGKWFGLLQILPATARGYGCRARSGSALKHGPDNLSCAIRIMSVTVPRDGVVSRGMRGVAADWGPFHSSRKRHDMMAWLKRQSYCKPMSSVRPRLRPDRISRLGNDE